MSAAAHSHDHAHDHGHDHHELGFVNKYIFSTDHKVIGIQYAITGLLFLLFGFFLMMLMRWQLGIRGAALFGGITFPVGATRTTAVAIEDHLRRLSETPMGW